MELPRIAASLADKQPVGSLEKRVLTSWGSGFLGTNTTARGTVGLCGAWILSLRPWRGQFSSALLCGIADEMVAINVLQWKI